MAQIQTGLTFLDATTYHGADLNTAINNATILPGVVTAQTASAIAAADSILYYQNSSTALRQCTITQLIAAFPADAVAATASLRTLGTGAQQACGGADSRLPASVSGVRFSAGAGSTDLAAVPANFAFASVSLATSGSININWDSADAFYINGVTGNITFTFSNLRDGRVIILGLFNTGSNTITWPSLLGATPSITSSVAIVTLAKMGWDARPSAAVVNL